MIYTPKIKQEVRAIPVPLDFVMDIVEYDFNPPYIALRFYESHRKYIKTTENLPKGHEDLNSIPISGKNEGHFLNRKANFNRVFTLHKLLVDYKLQNGLPF